MAYRKIGEGIQQEVSTQAPAPGQILKWDGEQYVPSADNAGTGSGIVNPFVLNSTNISNKYVDLAMVPIAPSNIRFIVMEGIEQRYSTDFILILDGSSQLKRVSWNGLGLESLLAINDEIIIIS